MDPNGEEGTPGKVPPAFRQHACQTCPERDFALEDSCHSNELSAYQQIIPIRKNHHCKFGNWAAILKPSTCKSCTVSDDCSATR